MLKDVKLEDFEKYRSKLFKYASNLLKGRGFCNRNGELKSFADDIVQQSYLRWDKCNLNAFVTEKHLENCLISMVYKEYLATIDLNRRGAQYILLKEDVFNHRYKEEFKQLDIRKSTKPEQEFFDEISSFKKNLDEREILVINGLLDGYSQKEISENIDLSIGIVQATVVKIRDKYRKYENSNS